MPEHYELWEAVLAPEVYPTLGVADLTIPGPHGPIPIRTYTPSPQPTGSLLWVHGGGFDHGGLDDPEAHLVSAELAIRANCYVASVDYRLAREGVRYPVPLDDVHAAWLWLCEQRIGLAEGSAAPAVAIGGASAGANLATATLLRSRDRGEPGAGELLLVYPVLHFPVPPLDDAALRVILARPGVERRAVRRMVRMIRNYAGRITDLPVEVVPGAGDPRGLPRTSVLMAEFDDLRPSGELFLEQLEESAIQTRYYLAPDTPHGYFNQPDYHDRLEPSLEFLAAALR